MNQERQRLFDTLPRFPRRDAVPMATLTCAYTGVGHVTVTVTDAGWVASGRANAASFMVAFDHGLTLDQLVANLRRRPGYVAALVDPAYASVLAATLLDDTVTLGATAATFSRATNPLWRFVGAVAHRLTRAAARIDLALGQLNLLTSGDSFATYWGTWTDTLRRSEELDASYTSRQLHEILRPRENNFALARLITEDTGIAVASIRDLRRDVFTVSARPLRTYRLAGQRYNTAAAEVQLAGFPTRAAIHTARTHVAAGVTVFVLGVLQFDALSASTLTFHTRRLFAAPISSMRIGVGAIGFAKIG